MKNKIRTTEDITKVVDEIHKEIQPALYESNPKPKDMETETEKEAKTKILKIIKKITDEYPELAKYIKEMQPAISKETNPEITMEKLNLYYDSLCERLSKCKSDNVNNRTT